MLTTGLSRKHICPPLPLKFLHREILFNKFNEAIAVNTQNTYQPSSEHKLVLLYAPAGYGKTTLLTELAQLSSIPCYWYHLEETDADTLIFLKSLIESLRPHFPQFETEFDVLLKRITMPEIENLVNMIYIYGVLDSFIELINSCTERNFMLFICNYQYINNNANISTIIDRLIQKTFNHCLIIIESRVIPNLDFAHLLVRRQVFILNKGDLSFTTQDICELAALQGANPVNDVEAEQISTYFDGWITGILLGTRVGGTQFLQISQHDRKYLISYVVNEIFQQEEYVYRFLKAAAILQQMTPSICAELLEIPDAEQYLIYLEQHGLFVTRLEINNQPLFVCNAALRDLLREDLQREDPRKFLALHLRAAHIFLATRDYEQSIYHAIQAHQENMAADLIFDAYEEMFAKGHIETLKRWIDVLPISLTEQDPRLLLISANIMLLTGEYAQAFLLLDTAEQNLVHYLPQDEPQYAALQWILDLTRGKALFQAGDYQQTRDLCQQVLKVLPAHEISRRADAYIRLGVCLNLLGEASAGIMYLQKSLQLWERNIINRQMANAHSALSSAYSLLGNFLLSEHHLSRSIACWEALHDNWGKIMDLIRRGIIQQRQGALANAEKDLIHALNLACGPLSFKRGEAYARANLADLSLEQEQFERALTFAEDSLALARQLKDSRLIVHSLYTLAMTYLLKKDAITASLFVSEIRSFEDHKQPHSYEHMFSLIAYGTLLFYEQRFAEASVFLIEGEQALQFMNLKHEQIQVKVRIAACHLSLQNTEAFKSCQKEIANLLTEHREYEHLVSVEIRRLLAYGKMFEDLLELQHIQTSLPQTIDQIQAVPPELTVSEHKSALSIVAFGEPIIAIQNEPIVHWRMARAKELFFFLLHKSRPVHKEQIIADLWPEVDEQTDHTFHTTIYYLRKNIDKTCLVSHAGSYTLDLAAGYGTQIWYDIDEFLKRYTLAKNALENEDDASAHSELQSMVNLYVGEYLQPFYSDWCRPRRDELRTAYVDAHRLLGQITWRKKAWDESLSHWQQMLTVDNYLEEAHYNVMRCYVCLGKKSLALRQYHHCVETLQQELKIKPSMTLRKLYQRLIDETS